MAGMTVRQLANTYRRRTDLSAATRKNYAVTLAGWQRGLPDDCLPTDLTPEMAADAERTMPTGKPSGRKQRQVIIKSFLRWLVAEGHLADDCTTQFDTVKVKPVLQPFPPASEVIDLLIENKSYDLRERAFWAVLLDSSARASEVLNLDIEDLDPPRGAWVIRKGGARQRITWTRFTSQLVAKLTGERKSGPIFTTARKAASGLHPDDLDEHGYARLSYNRAVEIFKAACAKEFGQEYGLHSLRRASITALVEANVSQATIMRKSGHSDVRTYLRYAQPSEEAIADATDLVFDRTKRRKGA